MSEISLAFPDSVYSESNKPAVNTLKADLGSIELAHNAHESDNTAHNLASKLDATALTAHEADTSTHGVTTVAGVTESQTLTNKTLTNPIINSMQYSGWNTLPALAWVSTDGSTNVVNATGDLTTTLSPGMRLKTQQAQALTAYWNLDANSSSQVGSFNGTDTAITYTTGKFSNAATFNGTTSKIVIADNASLKPTGEFTLGCWFKTSSAGAFKRLFQSYSQNTNVAGISLYITDTNVLAFSCGKNTGATLGTDYQIFTGATSVTDNAFHHVVVSFRNNYVQIYLDGKVEVAGYCLTPAYAATNYVRIGAANASGSDIQFMNGQIDDLFLINGYALDEKTIKAKYDAQTAQGTGAITVDKYALVTAVAPYAGGVTPITIWGGTDYSLANATISNPYYATVSQPFGFDRNPAKWTVEFSSAVSVSQASPTNAVWYNLGSPQISIPIGKWDLRYSLAVLGITISTTGNTQITTKSTLSTANNSESDSEFTCTNDIVCYISAFTAYHQEVFSREKSIQLTSKTTYYLNVLSNAIGSLNVKGDLSKTIIRATSTLL